MPCLCFAAKKQMSAGMPATVGMWLHDQQLLELAMAEEDHLVYHTLLFLSTLVECVASLAVWPAASCTRRHTPGRPLGWP